MVGDARSGLKRYMAFKSAVTLINSLNGGDARSGLKLPIKP